MCGGALCGAVVVPFMCGLPDGELASASAAPGRRLCFLCHMRSVAFADLGAELEEPSRTRNEPLIPDTIPGGRPPRAQVRHFSRPECPFPGRNLCPKSFELTSCA